MVRLHTKEMEIFFLNFYRSIVRQIVNNPCQTIIRFTDSGFSAELRESNFEILSIQQLWPIKLSELNSRSAQLYRHTLLSFPLSLRVPET